MGPVATIDFDLDERRADLVAQTATVRGVRAATLQGQALTRQILSEPGDGRTYKRGSITHQASKPGRAPAPDTGTLRERITTDVTITPGGYVVGTVTANTEYAAAQELGTLAIGGHIEERPFLSTVVTKYSSQLFRAFAIGARI